MIEMNEYDAVKEFLKKYYPFDWSLTAQEKKRLIAWVIREGWTRQKTIDKQFGFGDDSMPVNLVAPDAPQDHWSGNGKCVCVMCGYVSTVTNVHRRCYELPADREATIPIFCYEHDIFHEDSGKHMMHRSINMVAVS